MILSKYTIPMLLVLSQSAFSQVGLGLDMKGDMLSFPVNEVIVADEFFGDTNSLALTTSAIEVKSNNSTMINSASSKFGQYVLLSDNSATFNDPVAVSAYTNAQKAVAVLKSNLGFQFESQIKLVVDQYLEAPWTIEAPNLTYSEAGYIRDMRTIAFSPASEFTTSLAISLDIVAHEIAHLVISQTSKLDPSVGSQAINEAFGDIIGIYTESLNSPTDWNWKIGEEAYKDGVSFHRDIADANDPRVLRHKKDFTVEQAHALSGIVTTSFFYLVTGKDLEGNLIQEPVALDTAVKLYFETITKDLESKTNFTKLKDALILRSPELAEKITKVFSMVGM